MGLFLYSVSCKLLDNIYNDENISTENVKLKRKLAVTHYFLIKIKPPAEVVLQIIPGGE